MHQSKHGFYTIVRLHRDDIAEVIGTQSAKKLTPQQLSEIAERVGESLSGEEFFSALESVLDRMGIPGQDTQ